MPRTPAPQSQFVRPREACTFDHLGESVVLNPNEIVSVDDPIYRARPELFVTLQPSRSRPAVETTTAAPGERRGDLLA